MKSLKLLIHPCKYKCNSISVVNMNPQNNLCSFHHRLRLHLQKDHVIPRFVVSSFVFRFKVNWWGRACVNAAAVGCCCCCLWRTGAVDDTTMVACSFSPCGQLFVTGSTYGDLRLWDLDVNQLLAVKNAHDLGVTGCSFAPSIHSGESHVVTLQGKASLGVSDSIYVVETISYSLSLTESGFLCCYWYCQQSVDPNVDWYSFFANTHNNIQAGNHRVYDAILIFCTIIAHIHTYIIYIPEK